MFSWTFLGAVMVETSYSKQNTVATCASVNSKGLHLLKECDWVFLHQWTRTSALLDINKCRDQHSTILVVYKNKCYLEKAIHSHLAIPERCSSDTENKTRLDGLELMHFSNIF